MSPTFDPDFWLLLRMILPSALICVLIAWVVWRLRPVPYDCKSLKELELVYHAGSVACRTIYPIWCSDRSSGQEFAVLRIVGKYMYVGVYHDNWRSGDRSERFAFKGWTDKINGQSLLDRSDLVPSIPVDPRSIHRRLWAALVFQLN